MLSVNIAAFRAQLSKLLGRVRRGEEVVVLDRRVPVARLVPYQERLPLKVAVRKPVDDPSSLAKLAFPPLKGRPVDTLSALLEDRGSR
ncbi:MAG: type II toxin-antitoxin system prevent-host-death family antitoxin [Planctomycetes bacterium]|nr:type II toxin-antitoxin system prevent-host-death family antitoxin [Planctomycetota bacterium]